MNTLKREPTKHVDPNLRAEWVGLPDGDHYSWSLSADFKGDGVNTTRYSVSFESQLSRWNAAYFLPGFGDLQAIDIKGTDNSTLIGQFGTKEEAQGACEAELAKWVMYENVVCAILQNHNSVTAPEKVRGVHQQMQQTHLRLNGVGRLIMEELRLRLGLPPTCSLPE